MSPEAVAARGPASTASNSARSSVKEVSITTATSGWRLRTSRQTSTALPSGESDIEHDDVGTVASIPRDRVCDSGSLTDDREAGVHIEHLDRAATDDLMVVDDEDLSRARLDWGAEALCHADSLRLG